MTEERHENEVFLLQEVIAAKDSELLTLKLGLRPYRVALYSLSLALAVLSALLGTMLYLNTKTFLGGLNVQTSSTCPRQSSWGSLWGRSR